MMKIKKYGLLFYIVFVIFCTAAMPAYGAQAQLKADPVIAVKSYAEFYNALDNAVKNGRASLAVSISNYSAKTYNADAALDGILDGLKQSNSVLTEYKAASKLTGKTNRMDFTFKYETADSTAFSGDALYEAVIKAALETRQKVRIKTEKQLKSSLDVDKLYNRAVSENAALFYVDGIDYTWSVPAQGSDCILTVSFKYSDDPDRLAAVKAELEKKISEIVAKATAFDMTPNDKELALHDYLVRNTAYDPSEADEAYTPYGVLVKGKGNSFGYAKAMQLLLNKVGIECRIVLGEDGGAWNIVKIEDDYYHLDAGGDFIIDSDGRYIVTHDYFNLSDEAISGTHKWDRQAYPACGSTKANYFIRNNTLANNEKEMYEILKNAIESLGLTTGVKVKNLSDADRTSDIVRKIVNDHPDLDYISEWRWWVNREMGIVNIAFTYKYPIEQLFSMKNETTAKVDQIVRQLIKPEMTEYEKELVLHDYIVNHARYDAEKIDTDTVPFEEHDAYGVLIKRLGVCDSYAEAFKMLLDKAGIESMIVEGDEINADGEEDNGIGHAWNIVKIDGEYYHVDITWDDPVSSDGSQTLLHTYFNLTDAEMEKTHTWDKSRYPTCAATENNYFVKSKKLAQNTADIIRIVRSALDDTAYILEFKIKDYKQSAYNLRNILQSVLNQSKAQRASWSVDKDMGVVEILFGY